MIDNEYLLQEELVEDVTRKVMKEFEPKFNDIYLKLADIYASLAKITMRQSGFGLNMKKVEPINMKKEEEHIKSLLSEITSTLDSQNE